MNVVVFPPLRYVFIAVADHALQDDGLGDRSKNRHLYIFMLFYFRLDLLIKSPRFQEFLLGCCFPLDQINHHKLRTKMAAMRFFSWTQHFMGSKVTWWIGTEVSSPSSRLFATQFLHFPRMVVGFGKCIYLGSQGYQLAHWLGLSEVTVFPRVSSRYCIRRFFFRMMESEHQLCYAI